MKNILMFRKEKKIGVGVGFCETCNWATKKLLTRQMGSEYLTFSDTVAHQFEGTVDKVRTKVRTPFVTNFGRKL